jgi:hypothetical protein
VFMSGMNDQVKETLAGLNADHSLPDDSHYATRIDALRAAAAWVNDTNGTSADSDRDAAAATA